MRVTKKEKEAIYSEISKFIMEKMREIFEEKTQTMNFSPSVIRADESGNIFYEHECKCGHKTKVLHSGTFCAPSDIRVRMKTSSPEDRAAGYYACQKCNTLNVCCDIDNFIIEMKVPEDLFFLGELRGKKYVGMLGTKIIPMRKKLIFHFLNGEFYYPIYLLFEDGDLIELFPYSQVNRSSAARNYNNDNIKFSKEGKNKITEWIGDAAKWINEKYEPEKDLIPNKVYQNAEEFFTDYLSDKKPKKAIEAIKAFESGKVQIRPIKGTWIESDSSTPYEALSWEWFCLPHNKQEIWVMYFGSINPSSEMDIQKRSVFVIPSEYKGIKTFEEIFFGFTTESINLIRTFFRSGSLRVEDIKRNTFFARFDDEKIVKVLKGSSTLKMIHFYYLGLDFWEQIWSCFSEEEQLHYAGLLSDFFAPRGLKTLYSPEYASALEHQSDQEGLKRDVRFITGFSPKNLRRIFKIIDKNKYSYLKNYSENIGYFFSNLTTASKDLLMSQSDELIEQFIPLCGPRANGALKHLSPQKFVEICLNLKNRENTSSPSGLLVDYFGELEKAGITINKKNRAPFPFREKFFMLREMNNSNRSIKQIFSENYLDKKTSFNGFEIVPIDDTKSFYRNCLSLNINGSTLLERAHKTKSEVFLLKKDDRIIDVITIFGREVLTPIRSREILSNMEIKKVVDLHIETFF